MNGNKFSPTKGWLRDKVIPLNANGDPAFRCLGDLTNGEELPPTPRDFVPRYTTDSVMAQFTAEEITYLVNKQLYALGYQREVHKQRAAREREQLGPLKDMVKRLFGVSWIKATDSQIAQASDELKRAQQAKEEQEHDETSLG